MDRLRRLPGPVLVTLGAVVALSGLAQVLQALAIGIDFEPLRNAATSLLHGESIFSDPHFVYPPTAALVLLPTALGDTYTAFTVWLLAGGAALALTAWQIARQAGPPGSRRTSPPAPACRRPAASAEPFDPRPPAPAARLWPSRSSIFAAVALLSLLGGFAASRSLLLGNLTVFLAPAAVALLLAFHRNRWTLGCAILAATLLVKPLLAPLLLVPVLYRQWSALARTMLPAGALLLASTALVPGGTQFPAVLRYVASGTNLHGDNAINNLSLRGWAEAHAMPELTGMAAAAAALLLLCVRVTTALRSPTPPPAVWLGTLLLVGTLLAGNISEVHYLLVVVAAVLLLLALQPGGARSWWWFTPGMTLLAVPGPYVPMLLGPPTTGQTWLVVSELFLFAALLKMQPARAPTPIPPARPALTQSAHREPPSPPSPTHAPNVSPHPRPAPPTHPT